MRSTFVSCDGRGANLISRTCFTRSVWRMERPLRDLDGGDQDTFCNTGGHQIISGVHGVIYRGLRARADFWDQQLLKKCAQRISTTNSWRFEKKIHGGFLSPSFHGTKTNCPAISDGLTWEQDRWTDCGLWGTVLDMDMETWKATWKCAADVKPSFCGRK